MFGTWLLITFIGLLIGILSILLSYYFPSGAKVWILRTRIVNGVDHVGTILEIVWIIIVLIILFFFSVILFPQQSQLFFKIYWSSWWFLIAVIAIISGVFISNLFICPNQMISYIKEKHNKYYYKNNLNDIKERSVELNKLRVQYFIYSFSTIVLCLSLFISAILLILGEYSNFHNLSSLRKTFSTIEIPNGSSMINERVLYQANHLILFYSKYQSELFNIATQFMGVLSLVFLMFIWYLGSSWQTICNPASIKIQRYASWILLFIILPGIVLIFYFMLADSSNYISCQFNNIINPAVFDKNININADLKEQLRLLKEYHQIIIDFYNQYSLNNFWVRIVSCWGGILIIIELAFSFIQKKYGLISFLSPLFPRKKGKISILEAIFVRSKIEKKSVKEIHIKMMESR